MFDVLASTEPGNKKKDKAPPLIPTFQAAVENPQGAMAQILAMRGSSGKGGVHDYDLHTQGKVMPW